MNSQAQLNKVARQFHERSHRTLGFETPAERFNACVESMCVFNDPQHMPRLPCV